MEKDKGNNNDTSGMNPAVYVEVLRIFIDRMLVKKIIPIPFKDAYDQVLLDMDSLFGDEENRRAFREIIGDFSSKTDLTGWYEE